MLKKLIETERIPSPLLIEFNGDDQKALAQMLATRLLCETQNSCGICRGCKKVRQGFHPDWISLEGTIKMEELRAALRGLRQKPYEAAVRVLTVHDFDHANAFVQNALLKVFEEPEPYWYLIGILKSRRRLLSTLRSRCLYWTLNDPASASELEGGDKILFNALAEMDEIKIQGNLEAALKDRQKTKALCVRLLDHASRSAYPGHWKFLAPEIEQFALAELERNLHPKIIWEKAWARSLVGADL